MESLFIVYPDKGPDSEIIYEYLPVERLSTIPIVIAAFLYKELPKDIFLADI